MRIWTIGAIVTVVAGLVAAAAVGQPPGPPPGYYGIAPGHDFPADPATLEGFRAKQDIHAQRTHVWNVFAGINEPTPDGKYARWETWYGEDEAFQQGPAPQALGPHRVSRKFIVPHQLRTAGAAPQAAGSAILSFVLFNYETYTHIRTNGLYRLSALQGLQQTGAADRNIAGNRTVPEFPVQSMSLKVVWWPVAHDKITPMPIWDGDPNPASPAPKPNNTWPRVVAVDPTGNPAPNATYDISFLGKMHAASHRVPLAAFHSVVLDAAMASQLNADPQLGPMGPAILGRPYQAGDFVVLAGMHMTTKEIKDWVWATFWWHDRPDDGPFAADRPAGLPAPWNHYLMSASYDLNTPSAADGGPHTAFNPWLETAFANGVNSNCMNCHQRAGVPNVGFKPVKRGNPQPTDPAYASGSLRTDFLWSITDNAQ